jgi:hypothetical protein
MKFEREKNATKRKKRGVGEVQPSTGTVATPSAGFVDTHMSML